MSTYIALLSPATSTPSILTLHRLTHSFHFIDLPSSLHTYSSTTLTFPSNSSHHKIIDAKFADDYTLLVLATTTSPTSTKSKSKTELKTKNILIALPYTPSPANKVIPYTPHPPAKTHSTFLPAGHSVSRKTDNESSHGTVTLTPDILRRHTRHVFEGRFTPLKLVVNGREGRRVVVVLGSDCRHYRVLDLDFREGRGKEVVKDNGDEQDGEGGDGDNTEWSGDSDGDEDVEMGGA